MRQSEKALTRPTFLFLSLSNMKALSIRQPWAWAVAYAGKDIENRSWHMRHRGVLAIHASKSITKIKYEAFVRFWREGLGEEYARLFPDTFLPPSEALTRGAVIALAEAVDCVHESSSPWFAGPHGLFLQNVRVLRTPVHCRGVLGFFELPSELINLIEAQL